MLLAEIGVVFDIYVHEVDDPEKSVDGVPAGFEEP